MNKLFNWFYELFAGHDTDDEEKLVIKDGILQFEEYCHRCKKKVYYNEAWNGDSAKLRFRELVFRDKEIQKILKERYGIFYKADKKSVKIE